ncbi:hypothetical protein Lsan_1390 [Legionella santicrucis]|uniref:Uncharacterized protein n=1 Tax=Legionella santicrucis TaxID=45074 RepID=A0A0W0Z2B1_9GAMM|nr:hypothetical protein [Legionella santicrucis]KTD63272.1 hypothetical protein Lsan_1390 [Legionella santicrucis]
MKKIFLFMLAAISIANQVEARKPLASGDVLGRDLLIPGAGWIGHVGLGTGDDVGYPTQIIIEVLNESPVVQFNSFPNFTSRSQYWGSRSGVGDYSTGTYKALAEGYHQSWWCPTYSSSTAYVIGQGNLQNRRPTKCGMWRCDTFIAWDFYSAGFSQIMDNKIMLPIKVFYTFPYANGDVLSPSNFENITKPPHIDSKDKQFSDLSAEELNNLPYERFVELADIPMQDETPTHIAKEWEFAANTQVNETKRGIFIDRLAVSNEQDVIPRFLKMYQESKSLEIHSKLIQGLMIYYQNNSHSLDKTYDNELLKSFYAKMLYQNLERRDADKIIRGYIDFHSAQEIINSKTQIEQQMVEIEPRLVLGLKLELAYKSLELEKVYIPDVIKMLKKYQRSDLDGMFFGITQLWHKNLKDKHSIEAIQSYLDFTEKKYMRSIANTEDLYFSVAKSSFTELKNSLLTS